MPRILVYIVVFLLLSFKISFGSEDETILGKVLDDQNSEPLIGATIVVVDSELGTISDIDGTFELKVPVSENHKIIVSYIGFVSDTILVNHNESSALVIKLSEGVELQEVEISNKGQKARNNYLSTRMSYVDLPMSEVNKLPALLSENDVLKAIQLLPGVQSAEGASTGFYVRGGASDQNLILLNDAVVFNPFHAAGFISIFNGDFIDDISIHKAGIPSSYGGRLSSLLNVNTKTPSYNKVKGSAGIGLVTAKLTVELPVVKDKLSILLSGRGFYSFALFRALASEDLKKDLPQYYFYDAFGQVNWKASKKDEISVFYYNGKDLVAFEDRSTVESTKFNIPWSNTVMGGSWKHQFGENIISKLTAYHTKYDFMFGAEYVSGARNLTTGIRDWGAKYNISHVVKKHYLNYGVSGNYMNLDPKVTKDISAPNTRIADVSSNFSPLHFNVYLNDDWSISQRFGINYGLRLGLFKESNQYYFNADPKIIGRYNITEKSALKASYSYASQFVHMLVNSTATTPLDLWISSTEDIKPQKAHSFSLGWYQNFKEDQFEVSIESYYKRLNNQIEYKEGVDVFSNQAIEDKLLFGNGRTTGIEFLIRKREGKITGFVGYTLAWAQRQFDELNEGQWFDYKFDRRHDLTIFLSYQITDRWSVSSLFVLGTGHAISTPQDVYFTPRNQGSGAYTIDYGERNSYRLKPFHRLDLSVKYSSKPKRVQSHFKLDVYNVYNRSNAFFVILTSERQGKGGTKASLREYSLIPILPSISYQLEF